MIEPYWSDGTCSLYLGDSRELMPALGPVDLVVADPPYGETSLAWDTWPDGWLQVAAGITSSLWCFGSMRMFLNQRDEFTGWKLSQDVIWEKHNGPGFQADRFRRVHELALHWYSGAWNGQHRAEASPAEARPSSRRSLGERNGQDEVRARHGDHSVSWPTA